MKIYSQVLGKWTVNYVDSTEKFMDYLCVQRGNVHVHVYKNGSVDGAAKA